MTHPLDVADAIDRLERWTSSTAGRGRLQHVLKEMNGWDLIDTSNDVVDRLMIDVDAARLYWLTDSMISLLTTAADEMPDQALLAGDLPTDRGLVMFADELPLSNQAQPLRAVSWAAPGLDGDAGAARFTAWFSRATAAANNGRTEQELRAAGIPPIVPVRWFDWHFGLDWRLTYTDRQAAVDDVEDTRLWAGELRHFMQALFAVMGERYVTLRDPAPSRTERRRAERAGWDTNNIRVVDFMTTRTTTSTGSADSAETGVEWSQQWWVSGHWRNQWYPSLQQHRLRYIAPHIKGPQDRPLGAPPRRVFRIDTPRPQ